MRTLLCILGLLLAAPASAYSLERSACRVRETVSVADMKESEKLCRSLVRALARLPETAAEQALGMLTPENLEQMALATSAWLGTQGIPVVGQAVDAALLALGVTLLAVQMGEVAEALWSYANLASAARSELELDKAAAHLSRAIATAGVNLVGFILTKKAVGRLGSGPPAARPPLVATGKGSVAMAWTGAAPASSSAVIAANAVVMATGPSRSGNQPPDSPADTSEGPGRWERVKPTGSEQSQRYQQQITGRPATEVYKLEEVEFDGFREGVLREAKGPGYKSFFEESGQPKEWYESSGKFRELMIQAGKQSMIARKLGLPLRWHVAEAEVAKWLRRHFTRAGLDNIDVVNTAAKE